MEKNQATTVILSEISPYSFYFLMIEENQLLMERQLKRREVAIKR